MNKHPPLSNTLDSLTEFWAEIANQTVEWIRPWDTILKGSLNEGVISWFAGGQLNVSVNCLDRHLPTKAEHTAIIWQGDEETAHKKTNFCPAA